MDAYSFSLGKKDLSMNASQRAIERRRRILNTSSQRLQVASGFSNVSENNIHGGEKDESTFRKEPLKENDYQQANVTKVTQQDSKDPFISNSVVNKKQEEPSTRVSSSQTWLREKASQRLSVFRRAFGILGTFGSSRVDNLFRPVCFMFMGLLFAVIVCSPFEDWIGFGTSMFLAPLKSVSFFTWFITLELVMSSTKIMSSLCQVRQSKFQQLMVVWELSQLVYRDLLCGLFGFLSYFRWHGCTSVCISE